MAASAKRAPKDNPIVELARAKWKSSGLSDDHAKALRLRPLAGDETYALQRKEGANDPMAVGSVLLPYFDLDGKETDFYRLRYLEKLPGFSGVVAKPQRYWQPPRTLNEAYLPPILEASWKEIAEDPRVPVYITEGEFKAGAACSMGLACIGLGGVDVWRSAKRGVDFLPILKEFDWKGRAVVIIYDSDTATNPNVVRAQRQLAHELIGRGANPAIATVPTGKDGKKQGLDDYLVAHGVDKVLDLLDGAPKYPEADALWGLNEEVMYVRDPGVVVELRTGLRFQPSRFVQDAYSDRHYTETITTEKGQSMKQKPLASRWIQWEGRAKVERMVYEPGCPRIYEDQYNVWPGWGVEPKRGEVSAWNWLLDFLFKSDPDQREWFEKWCAYPLQHPGAKMYSAAMIWGTHKGTGKSLVYYALQGIYGTNSVEINNKDLKGTFNSWAKNRQFVHMSEISGSEARVDADWLKNQITQSLVKINEKYLPEYIVRDCMNYGGTSNHPDSLFIEDADRRYFVHEVVGPPAERVLYEKVHAWLHGKGAPGSYEGVGAAHLFDYLLKLDLKGFNPREHAPMTRAKRAMNLNSKSELAMWCVGLIEDPANVLKPLGEKAAKGCDLFTPTQILRAFNPEGLGSKVTSNGVARELARAGFRQMNGASPIRTKAGLVRLYAIRNKDRWETAQPKEMALHFDKFFSPDSGRY